MRAKITIIVVENREPYYFIIVCKYKEVPLFLFSYQMLAPTLTGDERSIYYKVYAQIIRSVLTYSNTKKKKLKITKKSPINPCKSFFISST